MRERNGWTFKLGSTADNARFIREAAAEMTPEMGLAMLESMRSQYYDDPENPPRLERVFTLSEGPRLPTTKK